jgi:hypothetical protein
MNTEGVYCRNRYTREIKNVITNSEAGFAVFQFLRNEDTSAAERISNRLLKT